METSAAPEIVAVPPGRVTLSDRRTRSTWQVDLTPYRMAIHPVTQEQYAAITGEWPGAVRGEDIEWNTAADGYRLPTEAEWEHACRADTSGSRYAPLDNIAWYRGNSDGQIQDVGGKQPNAWGLYDMLGNVWEWCWDLYDPEAYGTYRVLRGGGWFDEPWSCRASVRRRSHPTLRIDDVGFRIVLG